MNNKAKRTLIAIITCLALLVSFTGCGSPANNNAPAPDETKAPAEETQAPDDGAALKIAIVTSPSGVDDGSFNQDNHNGILSFIKITQVQQ